MTDQDNTDLPFEVGYGKPPRHTQFAKGQVGQPQVAAARA